MTRQPIFLLAGLFLAGVLSSQASAQATSGDTTSIARSARDSDGLLGALGADVIQHRRALDQRGVNQFEAPKRDTVSYRGQRLAWGAAFSQQYQSLSHRNSALPMTGEDGSDVNALMPIGAGFNNAVANLYLDAQLARGIRVAMTSYPSSARHKETWVKDGYILIDASPFDVPLLNRVMRDVTVRIGQFETNYGDAHFRRSDNGQGLYNPFIGNLIMDAFTVEIGGEAYYRPASGVIAMVGATAGQDEGSVRSPGRRSPAYLAKLGFDRRMTPALRTRLTGSVYRVAKSPENVLFSGDRAGSRYQYVLENGAADVEEQSWAGNIQPAFGAKVSAFVLNPFVKYRDVELFGNIERARGREEDEPAERTVNQYAGDLVYRFFRDRLYVAGRYNTVTGALPGNDDIRVTRSQLGAGWFLNRNMLLKSEWVRQRYDGFDATDIRNGGRFRGLMVEAAVSF